MRFSLFLILLFSLVTVGASAERHSKKLPQEREKSAKSIPAGKQQNANMASNKELSKLEHQTVKVAGAGRTSHQRQHVAPVKIQHDKPSRPINVASKSKEQESGTRTRGGSKGRVRGRH